MGGAPAGEWRRGWPVVLAAMLGAGTGPGLFQNLSSLFTPSLEAAFGWSRGAIATAAGLALIGALVAPLVGRLADRIGVRPVIIGATAALLLGYLGLAALHGSMLHYQAAILVLVLALPGTSSLAYGKLIAARFVAGRGLALAVGTSGLALLTIVAAPLLERTIAAWGWQAGFLLLAAASVAVLPVILVTIRAAPADLIAPAGTPAAPLPGITAAEARRDPRFWRVVLAAVLVNAATTGLVTQLVPLGRELGLGAGEAALLLTAFGASAITGRLGIGLLVDRVAPQPAAAGFAALSALAFAGLALSAASQAGGSFGWVAALVFVAGLMNGAENDLLPFLCARLFGLRAYGEIYGSAMPLALLGTAAGIIGFGRLHDATGAYTLALALSAAALVGAGLCFATLRDMVPSPPGAAAATR